jgi:hypothetical protein
MHIKFPVFELSGNWPQDTEMQTLFCIIQEKTDKEQGIFSIFPVSGTFQGWALSAASPWFTTADINRNA